MKRRQVWQYWCEFCGKHNLSAPSISHHEKHCTANPDRICGMCLRLGEQDQKPIKELIACIDISKPDEGLSDLRESTDGCPACMLAAIRQCGAHWPGFTLMLNFCDLCFPPDFNRPTFDFKTECKRWWDIINDAEYQNYV